jgi:hypothetical protein
MKECQSVDRDIQYSNNEEENGRAAEMKKKKHELREGELRQRGL